MRRINRAVLLAMLIAVAPALTACESFDMDKLDIFNLSEKKKLPGDRKPLFPEGVPGVTQGVPPELVTGYQPPPEPEKTAEAPPAEPVKPKPKPKLKPRVTVAPPQSTPQQDNQSVWPAPPPPGTFSR